MSLAFRSRAADVIRRGNLWALVTFAMSILGDWSMTVVREHGERTVAPMIAAIQALLIAPAAAFMAGVVLRYVPGFQYRGQRVVLLYAGKQWTLWLLLLAMPALVLIMGCATVYRKRVTNAGADMTVGNPACDVIVKSFTLLAAAILVTVVLHMLAT